MGAFLVPLIGKSASVKTAWGVWTVGVSGAPNKSSVCIANKELTSLAVGSNDVARKSESGIFTSFWEILVQTLGRVFPVVLGGLCLIAMQGCKRKALVQI